MTAAVMKVAAKRLTNVEVEKFTMARLSCRSSIEVMRMSAVLTSALVVFPITTALMSSGTTEIATTADDDLVTGNGIDGWAATIVDEGSLSRRRDQYCC